MSKAVKLHTCGHKFHHSCIARWTEPGNDSCPMCRANIFALEEVLDENTMVNVHVHERQVWDCISLDHFLDVIMFLGSVSGLVSCMVFVYPGN